jgi:hypothetical protein
VLGVKLRAASGIEWSVALAGVGDESVGVDVVLAVEHIEFIAALFEAP